MYKYLFTPIKIGNATIKNRFVMAPMGTCLANENGAVTQKLIDHYVARARGGVGAIIIENASISDDRNTSRLSISNEQMITGLRELIERIKEVDDQIQVFLQLVQKIPGSSAAPYRETDKDKSVDDLSIEKIWGMIKDFSVAAMRSKEIGFDGIELHGAHWYSISKFLSPHYNHRDDAFGGSIDRNMTFALEIVRLIRKKVGPDYPLIFRINGGDRVDDGLTIEDAAYISSHLEKAGVDAIHVSAGVAVSAEWCNQPMGFPAGCLVPAAEAIKKNVEIPVIAVGKINNPGLAEEILAENKADLIALGRPLLADPDYPIKAMRGEEKRIRKCISCRYCNSERVHKGFEVRCKINASCGRDFEYRLIPTRDPKKVLVVGGGPAGMECARILAERGHSVTLFEKEKELGGQLIMAMKPIEKEEIGFLRDHLIEEIYRLNVSVVTGMNLSSANFENVISDLNPDVVVLAVGVEPFIPGSLARDIDKNKVLTYKDVLVGDWKPSGRNIIVIGGGNTGCETADYIKYQYKDCNVTIVEMLDKVASDLEVVTRKLLLARMKEQGVAIMTQTTVKEIARGKVTVKNREGGVFALAADDIIFATGVTPNKGLDTLLRKKGIEYYEIGDCKKTGSITEAIESAVKVASFMVP